MITPLSFLLIATPLSAAGAGGLLGFAWMRHMYKQAQRKYVASKSLELSQQDARPQSKDLIGLLVRQAKVCALSESAQPSGESRACGAIKRWWDQQSVPLELKRSITPKAILRTSLMLASVFGALGCLIGCMFTAELACVGLVLGFLGGFSAPFRAVAQTAQQHRDQLEAQLPEMLEVISLGMRSGLSFDRSFQLYAEHFEGVLAADCASAQRMWTMGLLSREEALRDLATSYHSAAFERTVEAMIRALRFGLSMSKVLEEAAAQARAMYRSRIEEQVAKAPVKMMIPTGVLILPAMLLLVLGPVLLELMQGF
ncbi:type II secretion system F family protein [Eggerthellaceae bacterium 3-80]|nr:type II secretion system protein [bacterium D16-34]